MLVSLGFTEEGTSEQRIEGGEGVRQAISEEEHPRQREQQVRTYWGRSPPEVFGKQQRGQRDFHGGCNGR